MARPLVGWTPKNVSNDSEELCKRRQREHSSTHRRLRGKRDYQNRVAKACAAANRAERELAKWVLPYPVG